MLQAFLKLLLICIYIVTAIADDPDLVVSLPDGKIRGRNLKTSTDKEFYVFQDIPFATPPIGDFRFKEPVPPKPWGDILDTTENTKICIQLGLRAAENENEDCLYLNVYTPVKPGDNSTDLLPVLFWIYGGSFTSGDSSFLRYGPQHFIDYGVIVVSANYRLGPLGFLTTDDGVIPGNLGLKDQNFALSWTYKNIKLFGGDPSKITIAGESAGAMSVGYHLISKKSEGLFRAAILESGTSLCSRSYQDYANYYAFQLGNALDPKFTTSNSTEELLKLLQSVTVSAIRNVVTLITIPSGHYNGIDHSGLIWTPVIENENQEGAFITGFMHEDIKNGNINKVPIIIGFNSEEELTFLNEEAIKSEAKIIDEDLSLLVNNKYNITADNKIIAGNALKNIYTEGRFQDDFSAFVKFLSDDGFTTSIIRHAELQSTYTDVYLYEFSHKGRLGGLNFTVPGTDTVGHTEELYYLWCIFNEDINTYPVSDILTHHRMLTLWTNFVKYLNPTPTENVLLENIIWPKVSPNNLRYLNINRTLDIGINPKQYLKWRDIIDTYAQPPLITY